MGRTDRPQRPESEVEVLFVYCVFLLGCTVMLLAGVVEQRRHNANLDAIATRVLVNGIRGKSSITRLCAGALRGGGLVTVAKTTGTAARFIHPDGSEEPVYRKFGIANVVEQIGIVRRAAAYRPDALVIECMAVMPELQEINQTKLIRSTIGVLCNVREDHLAEMGPTLDDVARSLSRSMPVGGICVTAERDRLALLEQEAARRNCQLLAVDPESVTDEEMRGFDWITFKENVAIALAVAELVGIPRPAALAGMWQAPPDPGVLSVRHYRAGHARLRFANVFAANDPESTLMNITRLLDQGAIARPLHLLINCRPDRVERNGQMGALVPDVAPDRVLLIGEPTRSALAAIPDDWHDRVVDLGGRQGAPELLAGVLREIDGDTSLIAVGNIHGQGELLIEELETLPSLSGTAEPTHALDLPAPDPPPPPEHDQQLPQPVRGSHRSGRPPQLVPPGTGPVRARTRHPDGRTEIMPSPVTEHEPMTPRPARHRRAPGSRPQDTRRSSR
jgi:poly-gamma-glutamate synthase PgsB/CapB